MECKPNDPCYIVQGRLNSMSPTISSITTDLQYRTEPTLEKRSKFEAAERAFDVLAEFNAFSKVPFFRPYIYGLNALTYGLILIDPLDRLE